MAGAVNHKDPLVTYGGDLILPGDPDALTVIILALHQFQTSVPRLRDGGRGCLALRRTAWGLVHERMAAQRPVSLAVQVRPVAGPAKWPGRSECGRDHDRGSSSALTFIDLEF